MMAMNEGDKKVRDLVERCLDSEIPLHVGRHEYTNGTIFYCTISDGFGHVGAGNKIICPHLKDSYVNAYELHDIHRRNPCMRAQEIQQAYRRVKNEYREI